MSVLKIINELASNNSGNFKKEVLEREKDNETLEQVFFYCLNPNIQYHIKKIPPYIKNDSIPSVELLEVMKNLDVVS